MNISIKGKNDHLIIGISDALSFDRALAELSDSLEILSKKSSGFYPRALFDFGCRKLSKEEKDCFFRLLMLKKSVIFDGFVNEAPENKKILFLERTLRNGDTLRVDDDCVIKGQINPGAFIYFKKKLYLLGRVSGTLVFSDSMAVLYGSFFNQAQLYANRHGLQDVTVFSMTTFYIKDDHIVQEEGGEFAWQESWS